MFFPLFVPGVASAVVKIPCLAGGGFSKQGVLRLRMGFTFVKSMLRSG